MTEHASFKGRRSLRLPGYDYSLSGAYYVTLCVQSHLPLFGCVENDRLTLSSAGEMVATAWRELPAHLTGVQLDGFVVMPNHLHGILVLTNGQDALVTELVSTASRALSLGDIIRQFKTWTMRCYAEGVEKQNWSPYPGRLWQRNYYEHVIRDENDLTRIRTYIAANIARWAEGHDPYGPRQG